MRYVKEMNFGEECRKIVDAGKCDAGCCGMFPMPAKLLQLHDKFAVQPDEVQVSGEFCSAMTNDQYCVFLDREKKTCNIYESRPDICKRFGADEHPSLQCRWLKPNGRPRSEASQKQVERHVKKMVDDLVAAVR
jgi:Fe-S-cluster containining protein